LTPTPSGAEGSRQRHWPKDAGIDEPLHRSPPSTLVDLTFDRMPAVEAASIAIVAETTMSSGKATP
jgi:hypothetical protein